MNNFDKNKLNDPRVAQIIDANLDRAREGLRVLEDWARFGLGREDFVKKIKNYRQILGKHHLLIYKEARNFINDECTGMAHPEQLLRNRTESIIFSNAARVQEALRVIEEFSRNHNRELSIAASRIRYEIYKLEIALINCENNRFRLKILQENDLYLITMNCDDLIGKIRNILEGGVKIIQYRAKDGNDLKNLVEAKKIKELCTKFEALFIVNDRIDLALASDADGIHLGQEDIDIKSARKILGFSKIIGVSAGKESEIKNAIRDGCDYLGIGAIFLSTTKKNKIPLGIDEIRRISKDINIPWFAIGGIKVENIPSLKANGIKKVAIISDLLNSENPKEKAMMLIKALSNENKS